MSNGQHGDIGTLDKLLVETEDELRAFIKRHRLSSGHDFERNHKDWPSRIIRWQGRDGFYYLIQIYATENTKTFTLWAIVSTQPFGFPQPGTFQQNTIVNLPMDEKKFRELLEENYRFLRQKGAEIKRIL